VIISGPLLILVLSCCFGCRFLGGEEDFPTDGFWQRLLSPMILLACAFQFGCNMTMGAALGDPSTAGCWWVGMVTFQVLCISWVGKWRTTAVNSAILQIVVLIVGTICTVADGLFLFRVLFKMEACVNINGKAWSLSEGYSSLAAIIEGLVLYP
jgi:hypothetical protein